MMRWFIVCGLLLLAMPQAVHATDLFEGKSPDTMISEFDGNDDGRLTFDELMQSLERSARKWFRLMDRNKDGVVSREDGAALGEQIEGSFDWLWEVLRDLFKDEKKTDEIRT